jgi:hypothetical protein
MNITRVQYIEAVMDELRALADNGVRYAVYLHDDGRTFMHLVHHNTAESERLPASLDSFKHFRARLKDQLEVPPKTETFALVQSSASIF